MTQNGDTRGEAQANSNVAYLRAKTEVMVNAEELRYRMKPKNIYKTKSIVSYHWSPKKRRQMQKRVNKITEPIENQTLDEIWESIKERKEGEGDMSNILDKMNITKTYQEEMKAEEYQVHVEEPVIQQEDMTEVIEIGSAKKQVEPQVQRSQCPPIQEEEKEEEVKEEETH